MADELAKARSAANDLADKSAAVGRTLTPMGDTMSTAVALREMADSFLRFSDAFRVLVELQSVNWEEQNSPLT